MQSEVSAMGVWQFIQDEILGMKWLNGLIGNGLSILGLDIDCLLYTSHTIFLPEKQARPPKKPNLRLCAGMVWHSTVPCDSFRLIFNKIFIKGT